MSRMRTLLAAATIAALAVLVPSAASAAPPSGERAAVQLTWYWGG